MLKNVIIILFLGSGLLYSQSDSLVYAQLYRLEREQLLSTADTSRSIAGIPLSEVSALLSSFEKNKEWEAAYNFLVSLASPEANQPDNELNPSKPEYGNHLSSPTSHFSWKMKIGSGYDYSSQDYDIVGLDNDSTIQSIYKSPGINSTLSASYTIGGTEWMGEIYANSNRYYSILSGKSGFNNHVSLLRKLIAEFYLLKNTEFPDYNFQQIKLQSALGRFYDSWNWQLDIDLQFKDYRYNSDYIYDHWNNNLQLLLGSGGMSSHTDFLVSYTDMFQPGFTNYDRDLSIQLNYDNHTRPLSIDITPGVRNYSYKHAQTDTSTSNSYQDALLDADIKLNRGSAWIPELILENIFRKFKNENEYENDFWYVKIKPGILWQKNNTFSPGIYGIFENEWHLSPNLLYSQDNFTSLGTGISLNYMHKNNYLLLSYEFIHRMMDSNISSISSYNQPGNIHNINLSFSWQLTSRFGINGMINYDYDRDWKEGRLNTSRIFNIQANYYLN